MVLFLGLLQAVGQPARVQAFTAASRSEVGLRYGYGQTCKASETLHFNTLFPRWGFFLTDANNPVLGRWRLSLVLEGVLGSITDHDRGWDIGVTPLLKLSYPFGRVLGYLEGGAGLIWENIDSPTYAHTFNFSPQVGVGFDIQLFGSYALSVAYRFRHTSNAGLYKENPGVNSNFFLIGVAYYY
ncbi:MAG: acyloxyacyl hydrolase [Desulfobacca sp.]|uniref:acyloxyacyl hydrolase n=1 Tax=Desulfobacca sp. TaxID=2067990 RepID=UPI00404A0405